MKKEKITSVDFTEEKQGNSNMVNDNKKTKQKSNAQKLVPILTVVIVSLLVILTCVLIAYYQMYSSSKQNASILEGVYASNYYSMVDNVNNLSVDIAKYSNLSTSQAKSETLQDMMMDCNYILAGLSVLPINAENVISATKFFNQVNGLCEAYAKALNNGKELTQEQELIFNKIGLVVNKIKQNFNKQVDGMYDSNFNFVDASVFDNTGMNELSMGMGNLSGSAIEYPTMIFDGPFSTALETKEVKGLKGESVSKEQAQKYLQEKVFKSRNLKIKNSNETNGDLATFDFLVEVEDRDYSVQISKVGSLLITMSGFAEGGDAIVGVENAIEMAETFANNVGFRNMQSVWKEVENNVAYINLAPVVENVIYYPDLVKVKVDLTSNNIIGFEAVNYALNNVEREFNAVLSFEDAEQKLGFDYEIINSNKAIIKLDSGKEVSAYEFYIERIDGFYFYYINSNTGEIVKIMKLVNVKNANKLI